MAQTHDADTEMLSNDATSNNPVDPLLEQMTSVLQSSFIRPPVSPRMRRFSFQDGIPVTGLSSRPEAVAVRSRDGTLWLPAPDEHVRTVRQRGLSSATSTPSSITVMAMPLEQHSCSALTCAARSVLVTTELLELILGNLETSDILSLRRTHSRWEAVVQSSPQLRLHFFVRPQRCRPPVDFHLLPLNLTGLTKRLGPPVEKGTRITLSLTAEGIRQIAPESRPSRRVRSRSIFEGLRGGLGSQSQQQRQPWPSSEPLNVFVSTPQIESLYITQPPIMGMQAFVVPPSVPDPVDDDLGTDAHPEMSARVKMYCDAGITLGFLATTAQELLRGNDVEAESRVVFKAIMSFGAPEREPRKRNFARSVTTIG